MPGLGGVHADKRQGLSFPPIVSRLGVGVNWDRMGTRRSGADRYRVGSCCPKGDRSATDFGTISGDFDLGMTLAAPEAAALEVGETD